jgi:hypothetical protein
MQRNVWLAALGLALTLGASARAEILKGVMAIRGAEMS